VDVLFVSDPPETFSPKADTTAVMIDEALRRGHRPWCAMLPDLAVRDDAAWARAWPLGVTHDDGGIVVARTAEPVWRPMAEHGAVVMRKDPPFDQGYLTATWILDRAGTAVFNAPSGLRDFNEKLALARFAELAPRTFVARDHGELRRILAELGGRMILKPVFGFGGREVLLVRQDDPNTGSLIELATAEGTRWTIAQEYLPAASRGDKRILLVDGEPIGAVLRKGAEGDVRNNFHAGGRPEATELDSSDLDICAKVGPVLRDAGQFFVGLDVIGGRLTEINVTSPTGMQEINRLGALRQDATMQARFWTALERKLGGTATT
jgi:glutathione synthase